MIREIIRPQTNQVIVQIPQDMVDKELELIVFATKQDTGTGTGIQKIKSRQLMDKMFEHAESATIPDDFDIDEILNDMKTDEHPAQAGPGHRSGDYDRPLP